MPAGTALKTWVLGAVVVGAALICGALLRRGGQPAAVPTPPRAAPARTSGAGPRKHWLVTERDVAASPALKDLQARHQAATDDETRTFSVQGAAKLGEPAAVIWLAELAAKENRPGGPATRALGQITNRDSNLELGDVATSDGLVFGRGAAGGGRGGGGGRARAARL